MTHVVVDASVARSASETQFPTSKRCRDVLMLMLEQRMKFAHSVPVLEEWQRHQSHFARKWRVNMAARKLLVHVDVQSNQSLRTHLETCDYLLSNQKEAALKDAHLIETAQQSDDEIILSLDDTAKRIYQETSTHFREIRTIVWGNPDVNSEIIYPWLAQGCKNRKEYQLS